MRDLPGVMAVPLDRRTAAIREKWEAFGFPGPTDDDRERDQVIAHLLDRLDFFVAGVECVLLDHASVLSCPGADPNLAELAYRYLNVVGDAAQVEIRDALETAEALAECCGLCGGVVCSECGQCPAQGCWECDCDQRDRDEELEDREDWDEG